MATILAAGVILTRVAGLRHGSRKIIHLICLIYRLYLIPTCYCCFVSNWQRDPSGGRSAPGAEAERRERPDMAASELDLATVTRVFDRCHRFIQETVCGTPIPAEFLGALTANESGGDPRAARFEDWIYTRLRDVAEGWSAAFWGIGRGALLAALEENTAQEAGLRDLATSWGYTQIMGYQVIGRKLCVESLLDPQVHFRLAVELLAECGHRFRLRLSSDFRLLFRCWNTGQPDGETFDPEYVAAGMRRMALYREIAKRPTTGMTEGAIPKDMGTAQAPPSEESAHSAVGVGLS